MIDKGILSLIVDLRGLAYRLLPMEGGICMTHLWWAIFSLRKCKLLNFKSSTPLNSSKSILIVAEMMHPSRQAYVEEDQEVRIFPFAHYALSFTNGYARLT